MTHAATRAGVGRLDAVKQHRHAFQYGPMLYESPRIQQNLFNFALRLKVWPWRCEPRWARGGSGRRKRPVHDRSGEQMEKLYLLTI